MMTRAGNASIADLPTDDRRRGRDRMWAIARMRACVFRFNRWWVARRPVPLLALSLRKGNCSVLQVRELLDGHAGGEDLTPHLERHAPKSAAHQRQLDR